MRPARSSLVAALVGALALSLIATVETPVVEPEPRAVVSFLDTGINPYHVVFRDDSPRAFAHPSTYIDGYPADAIALELTFDAADYSAAVKADCDLWKSVQPGQLYWFPGTRIVGGISFSGKITPNCKATLPAANILDRNGHGTMVASRGAGDGYGACEDCLIVAVQTPMSTPIVPNGATPPEVTAIRWNEANAHWIDAESNSWGPIVPGYDPINYSGLLVASDELIEAVEATSQAHLAFWASGNGAAFRGGVLGHPTLLSPHLGPSAISVGGHDSGYVNVWPGFWPHLVSDSCNAWAAHEDSLDASGDSVGGGTSGATPYVAGGSARILLEARRILGDLTTGVDSEDVVARAADGVALPASGPLADGVFTLAEWRDVTFDTATQRPARQADDGPPCGAGLYGHTNVKWTDVPAAYPEYIHIGYGAVDRPSMALAFDVLAGKAALPDRSDTDTFFTLDDAARSALHAVWTLPS